MLYLFLLVLKNANKEQEGCWDDSAGKVIAAKVQGPEFYLQIPCKSYTLDVVLHSCSLSTGEVETGFWGPWSPTLA